MSEQKTTKHDDKNQESKKNSAENEQGLASESSESEFAHEATIQNENVARDKKPSK